MGMHIRTDLACEAFEDLKNIDGTFYNCEDLGICKVESLEIKTENAANLLGKKLGKYITIKTEDIGKADNISISSLSAIISTYLKEISHHVKENHSVLVIGLGNDKITADAIGPATISLIEVSRHIKMLDKNLFDNLNLHEVSAFAPNVFGNTGIETFEIIKALKDTIKPDIIIAIDSLAAKSIDRLSRTIQITDTGISPGSGIGNRRNELSFETLGVSVIAIGIPTVVDYETIFEELKSDINVFDIKIDTKEKIKASENFFLTPKDADIVIKNSAKLLSDAINEAFF